MNPTQRQRQGRPARLLGHLVILSPCHLVKFVAAFLLFATGSLALARPDIPSLRETYKDDFYIGTCLPGHLPNSITPAEQELVLAQYSAITGENCMKPEPIHPSETVWNFDDADALVAYGQSHGIAVFGHTL